MRLPAATRSMVGAIAEEHGLGDALVEEDARGLDDLRLLALGKHHALRRLHRAAHDPAHDSARSAEPGLERDAIVVEIDEVSRDASRDGGPRDGRGDPEQHARIERVRNNVLLSERHGGESVQPCDAVGDALLRERGEGARCGHLHLLVDLRRAHVERTAKDERKAEDVVHLVRIIGATRRDDRIGAHGAHLVGGYLRIRIREREDDRPLGHRGDHRAGYHAAHRESDEDVRAGQRLSDRAHGRVAGEAGLVRVHRLRAASVHHAVKVAHRDVLASDAKAHVVLGRRERGGASAREHDAHLRDVLLDELEGVQQRGTRNNRGAVLIVVEDRNSEWARSVCST